MKNIISILCLSIVLNTCTEKQTIELDFIKNYINNNYTDCSNIYINQHPIYSVYALKAYRGVYNLPLNKKEKPIKWSFNKQNLDTLLANNQTYKKWNQGELHQSIKTIPDIDVTSRESMLFYKNIFDNHGKVLSFSSPVFNKDNTSVMFYFNEVTGIGSIKSKIVIFKKVNYKWEYFGQLSERIIY